MCRLALMNNAAIALLNTELAVLFAHLERSMGGHGNGIAALWNETKAVKIHKGLTISTDRAAAKALIYSDLGADWVLFHTRLATSGGRTSRNCHPFKSGQLVMAHNGHSFIWDELGRSIGISDSECITRVWSHLRLPLSTLEEVNGVFLGFHSGNPFVVKGRPYDALTVSVHEETGAILFASCLEESLRHLFDYTVEVGRFLWYGEPLDIRRVEPRSSVTSRYTRYTTTSTASFHTRASHENQTKDVDTEKISSPITLSDLRAWYQQTEQKTWASSDDALASVEDSPSLLQGECE